MKYRTSRTHPIEINELTVLSGQLGLTFCPGKCGPSVWGAPWRRDLEVDLSAIKAWGATTIVTLMEPIELAELRVNELSQRVRALGIEWRLIPIADLNVPEGEVELQWRHLAPSLLDKLWQGERLLIHCRGGLGRTGLIAAAILMEAGCDAQTAIKKVRDVRPGAIETAAQEAYLKNYRPYIVHASLLAGALGDSMGADIEFLSLEEIERLYPSSISQLAQSAAPEGWFTDDTQMTLFTAEGLLEHSSNWALDANPVKNVHAALLRWRTTQEQEEPPSGALGLAADKRLYFRAAPGNTCLSALKPESLLGVVARNNSKGCGSIMRVAPVAFATPRNQVRRVAVNTSALTHGHPVGQLAAAAWAELLADALAGAELEQCAQVIATQYAALGPFGCVVANAIIKALHAPQDATPATVEALGGGWVAEEALSIALYACLATDGLTAGLECAVRHSGDSDSTAAIAGNLLGLLYPESVFLHPLIRSLKGRDLIARLAPKLTPNTGPNKPPPLHDWGLTRS